MKLKKIIMQFGLHLAGLIALAWFLLRVIPKPSRATYPCQRAAFPLASAFVLWLAGFAVSSLLFKKAKQYFKTSKYGAAISFGLLSFLIFFATQFQSASEHLFAGSPAIIQQFVMKDFSANSAIVQPKAVVSIVRSEKANAADIDSIEIDEMVRNAVGMAGGFDNLIHDSSVVVLKPNLLMASIVDDYLNPVSPLPEKINSVTADYRVIQAVVNLVRGKNPHGKVYIIEGSAVGRTRDNMSALGWFKITGVDELICLDESCGGWRDTTAKELVKISLPAGKPLYIRAHNVYYLNKIYYEADVLISIPVLKTHSEAAMSGAVKNVGIGGTPVNIYGSSSSNPWRFDVIDHGDYSNNNCDNLHNWIHDFYMCRPVDFSIMDGLTGMQHGPTPYVSDPISRTKKNTRCILASKDALALDAIAALMVQVDPLRVKHLAALHNDSMGCADPKYIRVKGMRVDEVKDHYLNYVTYASYTDFRAPLISLDSLSMTQDTLFVRLTTESKVVKVEISVNGQLLDSIFTDNFANLRVPLGTPVAGPEQIKIYGYDKYLNCTIVNSLPTGVRMTKANSPDGFQLSQNFSNPFNPSTTIQFSLPRAAYVTLYIYNSLGQEVAQLVSKQMNAGTQKVEWNAASLPSGVYFYRLRIGEKTETKKMVLMK
jgi:uncharacterized protein (DUF362 family)